MSKPVQYLLISICLTMLVSCNSKTHLTLNELKEEVNEIKSNIDGDIAVAFLDLSNKENQILINSTKSFHAASTMKIPIMIELFKQQTEKKLNLNEYLEDSEDLPSDSSA